MLLEINKIVSAPKMNPDWELPNFPDDVSPKCLSDLIKEIPEFQRALFPNSRRAITQINRVLKTQQFIPACDDTRKANLYSSVALAIDRGALLLAEQDIIERPIQFLKQGSDYEQSLATIIAKFAPLAPDLTYSRETAGYLFVLGKLEPIMRGFRPISDIKEQELPRYLKIENIKEWFSKVISKDVAYEINALLKNLYELQLSGKIYANPSFGGIGPISGSDGDWISGKTLVELKCTVRGIKREYIAQLICYSALGKIGPLSNTIPTIKRIAICLPRQSSIIVGSIDDWLKAFGAPSSQPVFEAIENYFSSFKY